MQINQATEDLVKIIISSLEDLKYIQTKTEMKIGSNTEYLIFTTLLSSKLAIPMTTPTENSSFKIKE